MARIKTLTENEAPTGTDDFVDHPLFPRGPNDKPYDIAFIQITRIENGSQKWGPVLPADELQTEDQIFNMFGGGQYVLVGRKINLRRPDVPGGHAKSRHLTLAGRMKAFSQDPSPQEVAFYNGQTPGAAPPAPQGLLGGGGELSGLIALMMKMSQDANERSAQSQREFMQMFLQSMSASKGEQQAMMQMVLGMTQNSQTAMATLISSVLANRGGGPDEMSKYVKLLSDLGLTKGGESGEKEDDAESIPKMLENVADIVTGVAQLRGAQPPAPNGEVDPNPPAEGSAAGLLRKMGVG